MRDVWVRRAVLAGGAAVLLASAAQAQVAERRPDLADEVAGTYDGNVISDARGASQSDVRIVITRTGRNQVRINSDYPRLPEITVPLTRVAQSIQAASGPAVFLFETSKTPRALMLTFDDAAWSGVKTD